MTLTPRSYAALFSALQPRLFPDELLFDHVVAGTGLDLSRPPSAEALGTANSFTLIASGEPGIFRHYPPGALAPVLGPAGGESPLPRSNDGASTVLTLAFPTPQYEEEFGECRRYLPDTLTLNGDLSAPMELAAGRSRRRGLRRQRVLIDVPRRYC